MINMTFPCMFYLRTFKDDKKKNFTNITNYKPTGNLIYNNQLIESIENTVTNDITELKQVKL